MIDYQAQDSQVCAESTCKKCGNKGLEYFWKRNSEGYCPLSRCPECGYTEEF